MIKTVLTEMLGVEHPIMLAGMGGVSYANVVAAVSEAGGYGVLGAAAMSLDAMTEQIDKIRSLTKKPFGVDLLTAGQADLTPYVKRIIDGGATSFVAALGVPRKVIDMCHEAGLLVICMAGKVSHAVKAAEAGCDVIVAQGTEAGGHTGTVGGMALMPQIVDAVNVPVVGAGSIFDGRGLVAALAFGCAGVWIGTRFIASTEARASDSYKRKIIETGEDGTVVSRCWTGKTLRAIRNLTTDEWERRQSELKPFPIQAMVMHQAGVMKFSEPGEKDEADPERNCFPAGQGCGAIKEIKPCAEIIGDIMAQAESILGSGVVPSKPLDSYRRPLKEAAAARA